MPGGQDVGPADLNQQIEVMVYLPARGRSVESGRDWAAFVFPLVGSSPWLGLTVPDKLAKKRAYALSLGPPDVRHSRRIGSELDCGS